jgi:hypothetical protein
MNSSLALHLKRRFAKKPYLILVDSDGEDNLDRQHMATFAAVSSSEITQKKKFPKLQWGSLR